MVSQATVSRLRWHAGLEEHVTQDVPSVASSTWPRGQVQDGLQKALTDCLRTMGSLNHEWNQQEPRVSVGAAEVPRRVAYAVTEIIRCIRECQRDARDERDAAVLGRAAWRIETAWSAVLAGDVDDIERHVEGEEAARFG